MKEHVDGLAGLDGGTFDAYASDRVILFGLAANSKDRTRLTLLQEYFSYEPYGLVMRRDDAGLSPRRGPGARRALSHARRHPDLREVVRLHLRATQRHPGHVPPERAPGVAPAPR